MSDQTFRRSAVWITVLGAFLRYFMLLLRPVHHDEGVNGWMLTNLLRDNKYQYDPSNYHGPTIYFIAYPLMKLFGLETYPLRGLSSFFGLMMVVMVFYLRPYLGNLGTLLAAFFVAVSPGLTFVSRYFIHEIFFVFYSLCIVVSVLYFIDKRKAGPMAIMWMAIILLVSILPTALLGGKYLGGENETAVAGLRLLLFAADAAIVYYLMKWLLSWDNGRPIYLILAAASMALMFGTKETAFITQGVMVIAVACVWIWEKIGPGKTLSKTLQRNVWIGTGIAVLGAAYYYSTVFEGFKYIYTEFLNNAYRPQDPFWFYSLMVVIAVSLLTWFIYVSDLKNTNDTAVDQTGALDWPHFREALVNNKNLVMLILAAMAAFWYISLEFFTSFFSYKEGFFWKAFEAYDIWTKTGTKEHSQNGIWAYLKWGMKGEAVIIFASIIGSAIAIIKAKNRFAMFTAAWALGLAAAYMIIPYKTPWLALNYILPMCIIAGYGLSELILSKNRSLNLVAYALVVVGTISLGYQTYKINWVRYDDDQMPYVYAHTRRGFVDMINQIEYYAEKSGKGKDAVIDITSPDYWPMTWYVVNYNHVGYHGRIVDTNAEIVVTKKKDQDTEALAKYADKYKYVGMYPLRPGVDMNLLVRNDIADPPCSGNVQDGVQKGQGVVVYNTEHCTREMSVIPSIPMTP
jgi:predicted membrane-bound mannosyltransferase